MKNTGCLDWNDFIGERPVPPPRIDDIPQKSANDKMCEYLWREFLLKRAIGYILEADTVTLQKINDLLAKGGDPA